MNQDPLLASALIKRLMHDYCTAIDHGDFTRFGLLMKDARWLVEGEPPSPDSATNVIVYDDGTPRTRHVVSNIDITLADSGSEARGHSYVQVYQQTPDRPLQVIFVGEYFDEFRYIDGEWSFATRDIRHPLFGDLSGHLRDPSLTFKNTPF